MTLGQHGIGRHRRRRFGHRHRFAGEGRFIASQIGRLDDAQVGGHHVAGLDDHHVAGNELFGGEHRRPTVAPHQHRVGGEAAQRLHRTHRAQFGDKSDGCIDGEHGRDGDAFGILGQQKGEPGCRQQQIDDGRVELLEKDDQRVDGRMGAQQVGAES